MLKIKTISSGSKGNAYLLEDGDSRLLLECGIQFKKIQSAIGFNTSNLDGVLVSHSHGDHASGVREFIRRGIKVYTSQQCIEEIGLNEYNLIPVQAEEVFEVGKWKIIAFDLHHDVRCYGYLILTPSGQKVLFATDTYYISKRFLGVTHYMIECNYDEQTIEERYEKGEINKSLFVRICESHTSLETLVDIFKSNDLSETKEIHLLHLSDTNSNEQRIKETIKNLTGKEVFIA